MTSFWRTWMTVWCWAVLGFGLLLAAACVEATSGPARLLFAALHGPELDLDAQMRFTLGVLGAVSIGWSVTFMAALRAANLLAGDAARPVWRLVALSVVSWFAVDTPLSIATGYDLNAVPNLVFLAAFLLPLVRSGVLGGSLPAPRAVTP